MPFSLLILFYFCVGIVELFETSISKKFLAVLTLLPAFVLTAFRDVSVGNDTLPYFVYFERNSFANSLAEAVASDRMEIGYVSISYFFSHCGLSFFQLQFVISLFFYISLYVFLTKYSKNVGISCFVFLTMRYMLGPMNTVRMYIAIAFLLFSIPFVQKRKFVFFAMLVFLAALFHKTAILFILFYPLTKMELSKKNIAIAFSAAAAIAFLGKAFFLVLTNKLGVYENYLNRDYFNFEGKVAIYIILVIDVCLALFVLYNDTLRKNVNLSYELNKDFIPIKTICQSAVLCVCVLDIIGLSNTIMSRISGYFAFCWLILIPMVISQIKNKIGSIVIFVLLAACLVAYFEVVIEYRPDWNRVIPYSFYFGQIF